MSYADVLLRTINNVSVRIYGVVHSTSHCHHGSIASPASVYRSLLHFNPRLFLVESSKKSVELTKFVWDDIRHSKLPEQFCTDEGSFIEAAAVAAAVDVSKQVIPIDIDPQKTRIKLARKLLLHPWESLILISRYHGKSVPEVTSLEDVDTWRAEFRKLCPIAFEILFLDREQHMVSEILLHARTLRESDKLSVLVGITHVNALRDALVEYSSRNS